MARLCGSAKALRLPNSGSGASGWGLEVNCSGSIFTTEVGNYYGSGFDLAFLLTRLKKSMGKMSQVQIQLKNVLCLRPLHCK